VVEDSYSDRLDQMACCRGDYSLQQRILAGWVPAAERAHITLADVAVGDQPQEHRFVLWPYDRAESKGRLRGVSIRLEDGKVLVMGYRSAAFWPDLRISHSDGGPGKEERRVQPEHVRSNVAGLSVEYSRRFTDAAGE
jgi:hypothetical protein